MALNCNTFYQTHFYHSTGTIIFLATLFTTCFRPHVFGALLTFALSLADVTMRG